MPGTTSTSNRGRGGGSDLGCLIVGVLLLSGPALFLWQCYGWIRYGVWVPWSLLTLFILAGCRGWFIDPQDWIGLHRLIDALPASLALLAVGLVAVYIAANIIAREPTAKN